MTATLFFVEREQQAAAPPAVPSFICADMVIPDARYTNQDKSDRREESFLTIQGSTKSL